MQKYQTTPQDSPFQWPAIRWPWERLSKEFKQAFLITFFVGLVVHQFAVNNLLLGNDSQHGMVNSNDSTYVGRWALKFFSSFSTDYQSTTIIVFIVVLMIALTAGLTVRLLELTHPAAITAVSALLITFPVIADTFAYMFTADAYFIALFMNTLAVYLTKRYRFGFLAAVLLISTACGVYQAYICYAIGLFLFDCILALLSGKNLSKVLRQGFTYIAILVSGLALYTLIATQRNGGPISVDYQGVGSISQFSPGRLLRAIPRAYDTFEIYCEIWPHFSRLSKLAHQAAPVLCVILLLFLILTRKIYREPVRLLLLAAGVLIMPLALYFVAVLAYEADIHSLMIYAHVLLFVFMVKLAELASRQLASGKNKRWFLPALAGLLCCCMVVWNNFCITGVCYHALQARYETAYAMGNRVLAEIGALDGYVPGETPVLIMGAGSSALNVQRFYPPGEIFRRVSFPFLSVTFLNYYCAANCPPANAEQTNAILAGEAYASMPVFPAAGSIRMIDGIAVAKFS